MQEPQEMQVLSLGQEDPLEEEMATHLRVIAWKILWIEEPGRLQFMGSQRVRQDWACKQQLLQPFLHFRDKSHLIVMYDFNVLLN